ncbi:hypothetical protein [Sulfitobacter sp. JL08]|uniref:hypothetical protein n=1 Tax=unclassified Sulfitobacter TaxID=196795 RepID=UPI0013B465BE|nr:hypothetical protein [Sulfitobacter sp. JL08]
MTKNQTAGQGQHRDVFLVTKLLHCVATFPCQPEDEMGLKKIAEKLDTYYKRLELGKAAKIQSAHVEKVIAKLQAKQEQLKTELSETEKPSKKQRLEGKLATVEEQITRSEWLLREIGCVKTP